MKPLVYRKLPIEVEAIQYSKTRIGDLLDFARPAITRYEPADNAYYIETLEGTMKLSEGDYVIKGVAGEFYPCKPEIFEQTYERLIEPAPYAPKRWERVAKGETYYFIDYHGFVDDAIDLHNDITKMRYESGNYFHFREEASYFRDKQLLNTVIRRWKLEHDAGEIIDDCRYYIGAQSGDFCYTLFETPFSSKETANLCMDVFCDRIDELVQRRREWE